MAQLVNLPDGSQASFPDGTPPEVMKAAIQKKFPAQKAAPDPGLALPNQPSAQPVSQPNILQQAGQVASQMPMLAPFTQGIPAIAKTLGMDNTGRNPMDALATLGENTFSSVPIAGPALHNAGEQARALIGRSLYGDPNSTPETAEAADQARNKRYPEAEQMGKIAGPVASYLLASRLPGGATALGLEGSLGSRLGFGLGSQYAINTGDELTHGKSLGDALINSVIPTAESAPFLLFGKGPGKVATERDAAVQTMKDEGVSLTAGQKTGSNFLKYRESELGGSKADSLMEQQKEEFTKAALKRAGVDANRATPEVMDQAFSTLGNHLDRLGALTDIPLDQKLQNDMLSAVTHYQDVTGAPAPIVEKMMNRIGELAGKNGGVLQGEAYQNIRSEIGRTIKNADGPTKGALGEIQEALDDAVGRHISPRLQEAWQTTRTRYKNLLAIEDGVAKAGPDAALGLVSPANLSTAVRGQGKRAYVRGRGDLNELARSGVSTMTPLPNSGTASRLAARGATSLPTVIAGALAGHDTAGLPGAVIGGLAGTAAPYLLGRALLSGVGRSELVGEGMLRQLGNSTAPNLIGRALLGGS